MNKRTNSVLFILAATVFNVVVMAILFLVFLVLVSRVMRLIPYEWVGAVLVLVFGLVAPVILTYFIYHRLVRYLSNRYDFERYFGRRNGHP